MVSCALKKAKKCNCKLRPGTSLIAGSMSARKIKTRSQLHFIILNDGYRSKQLFRAQSQHRLRIRRSAGRNHSGNKCSCRQNDCGNHQHSRIVRLDSI